MKEILIILFLALQSPLFSGNWIPYDIPTNNNLNDVFFLNESIGWIVGDNGIVFKFVNDEWIQIDQSITTENLNSIFFSNDSIGWIVGDNGVILKYENEQFVLFESPTNNILNGVSFIGEEFGWIVGNNRTILEFKNEAWQLYPTEQFSSILGDVKRIQFLDSSFGAILAGGGSNGGECILTYENNQWTEVTLPYNTTYLNGLFVLSPKTIYTTFNRYGYENYSYFLQYNTLNGNGSYVSNYISQASHYCDIDIADNIGWASHNKMIYKFENGSFTAFNGISLFQYLKAVEVVNDSVAWIVGESGTLLKYDFNTFFIEPSNRPYAKDNGNTNTSEDIKVSFIPKNTNYISEYRAFVFPNNDTTTIDSIYASTLSEKFYTSISTINTDTIFAYLNENQLDYFGNPIANDIIYCVRILSVPDSIYSFIPVFSEPSRIFKLETEKSFYAGQKDGAGVYWHECDSLFCASSYIYDINSYLESQVFEIDLNRDGIMDITANGYKHFGAGGKWTIEYGFTGINNNKVMTTFYENKEDWIDIIYYEFPINEIYHWYSDYGILFDYFSPSNNPAGYYNHDNRTYYLAFSIEKDGVTQYAWLKLKGLEYLEYGYFENNTGLEKNEIVSSFNLFPNPTSDLLHIQSSFNLEPNQNTYITVYNLVGIQIDEFLLTNMNYKKNISQYSNGMYFFVFTQDEKILETHKVLIE